ncbi:hypothetical protein [Anaeromyxobacter dehalogenans]|uniref:Tetratricopeptide repeat protein n=1 Tax=Anaeromyxobacter dehalogenans (strain 2CP-C) TaxID=290397 RepID=Q2IJ27_ANADE|nr:hypothetical protein [Anaeromyxobacter dehalogenans]ABC81661.1 hypothetical protein Adeh_1890 [Anaeromyxobacter dehalogenans 2CP-C]
MATLPDPLPDFIVAAGQLAAAAVARGDRGEARRLLEAALRAVKDAGGVLHIVATDAHGA